MTQYQKYLASRRATMGTLRDFGTRLERIFDNVVDVKWFRSGFSAKLKPMPRQVKKQKQAATAQN